MTTLHPKRWFSLAGTAALLTILAACSPGVPQIRDLKVGKDKDVSSVSDHFGVHEKIFAIAHTSGVSEKMTMKWQLIAVKAGGMENFRVPNLAASYDLDSGNDGTYSMEPPEAGWPTGQYRFEAGLYTKGGEKKDEKTSDFTVPAN